VQWLDAPAVGPLLICRRNAPATIFGARSASRWLLFRSAWAPTTARRGRSRSALVLDASGLARVHAAGIDDGHCHHRFYRGLTLPHVRGFGQANSMTTATRQLLDDVALARQRAMVNRSTVYMVFLPPMFWTNAPFSHVPNSQQVTNLLMHQYSAYALVSLATVGDQPGQHHPRYVTDWRFLPRRRFHRAI
jgi:hypothetical protein